MRERIQSLAGHLREDIRLFGVGGTVPYLIDRALARASGGTVRLHKYWIVGQPVCAPAGKARARASDFTVREVTEADARYEDYPRPESVIRARFRQNARCLACYRGEQFVGYIWFNVGPYIEDEVRCRFVPQPPGRASWDYDAFVCERYRLGRAFKLLWDATFTALESEGVAVSYSRISAFNAASLAAHRRMGSERVGTLFFLQAARLQCMLSSMSPFVHLSIAHHSKPTVVAGPRPNMRTDDEHPESSRR